VIEPEYDHLSFMTPALLKARSGSVWGIITIRGDTVLPFDYDAIGGFSENRAMVARNRKCGFIDGSCRLVVPMNYVFSDYVLNHSAFTNGYVLLRQKGTNVLVDSTGKKISFRGMTDYGQPGQGYFPVRQRGRWGYADAKGAIVIRPSFSSAGPFEAGTAIVSTGSLEGVIDTAGVPVIEPRYDRIIRSGAWFLTLQNGLYGLADAAGKSLLDCRFDRIDRIGDRIAVGIVDDRRVYFNLLTGKIVYEEP